MNIITLKVKRKSLAAEIAIIKKSERGQIGYARYLDRVQGDGAKSGVSAVFRDTYGHLHHHRTVKLRRMSRVSHLANGFIKGMPYHKIEQKCRGEDSEQFMISLARAVSEEISRFGHPEMKNMVVKDRDMAVSSWMNI